MVIALAGCLPQGASDDEDSRGGMSFAGAGAGTSSTAKGDALLPGISTRADRISEAGSRKSDPQIRHGAAGSTTSVTTTSPDFLAGDAALTVQQTRSGAAATVAAEIRDLPAETALANFFRALSTLEGGGRAEDAVTILHLGDGHIAADRFSGDMREQFQSRFGNAGRGLLMPGIYLSRGVKFDQGGKWFTALSTGNSPGPYGITGVKITGKSREDWLRLTTADTPFAWAEITFQAGASQGSVLVSLDGESKLVPAGVSQGAKAVRLDKTARELLIRPKGDGPVTVHGITIGHDKPGVRYVNLGLPGATALTPLSWNAEQVTGDLRRIGPHLVVLGYGTAESFDDGLDLRDYEAKLNLLFRQLRQAAPSASFLIIGPPDVARLPQFASGGSSKASDVCRALSPQERATYAQRLRNNDLRLARWHPPLRLDDVRAALRRAASANQAYFWDWSKLMGGTCGIHAWVHSDPPLAASDHVHLTEEGSKRSARLLFRELMAGYDAYDRAMSPVESAAVKQAPTTGWKAVRQPVGGMGGR